MQLPAGSSEHPEDNRSWSRARQCLSACRWRSPSFRADRPASAPHLRAVPSLAQGCLTHSSCESRDRSDGFPSCYRPCRHRCGDCRPAERCRQRPRRIARQHSLCGGERRGGGLRLHRLFDVEQACANVIVDLCRGKVGGGVEQDASGFPAAQLPPLWLQQHRSPGDRGVAKLLPVIVTAGPGAHRQHTTCRKINIVLSFRHTCGSKASNPMSPVIGSVSIQYRIGRVLLLSSLIEFSVLSNR